ncbi:TPM domain-containing protein [Methylophilus glucosoxydans]|uniref:TPM domain-containing protein n=1 Tax=Methylophilus glucosoxydans TaxID=752553 RepID=A0ABW3GDZ2_9PROT|nr:YgcG family protein [Methylophilus sp. 13]MBF5040256.1 YgcG family protein [Methylophilus sp. 13]
MALVSHADDLVAIPALQAAVTDLTQTLRPEEQAALNQKLSQFAQQAGSQVAVLILPSTQPEDIAQFGIRLAEAWKIGRDKQDDGVIVIVAKNDKKMRIEVGYGLEGAIPDAIAKRIIAEQMAPAFKQGQFYNGLNLATDTLIKLIQGEQLPAADKSSSHHSNADGWMTMLPILMFAAIIAGAIFKSMLGDFPGSLVTGGALGVLAGFMGATLLVMGLVGLAAFVFTLAMGGRGGSGMPYSAGGFGGYSGGSRGPDIFSGGGGDFGGGGASGDW